MSLKYKITVLALVILSATAVLFLTNQDMISGGAVETEQTAASEAGDGQEEVAGADDEFKVANDPYQVYLDAREAGKPAVIKFYARW